MKFLLIALLLLSFEIFADDGQVIRLSEPVQVTETHEVFGAELPEAERTLRLSELIDQSEAMFGQDVLVETEIAQVCQKKGCFFIARDGDAIARVRFKDYGFFIPTDAGGKTVVLAGALSKVELTPEQAAHFAEDLNQPAPAEGESLFEYQITARSVQIPLN